MWCSSRNVYPSSISDILYYTMLSLPPHSSSGLQDLFSVILEVLDVLLYFEGSALKVGHLEWMFILKTHAEFQKCKLFPQTHYERSRLREKLLREAAKTLRRSLFLCV